MQRRTDTHPRSRDEFIDSPRNTRVRGVARLFNRRERERRGVALAEGAWALRTALDAALRVDEVYYCASLLRGDEPAILDRARAAGARPTELGPRAMARLSYRDGPDAIVAVVERPVHTLGRTCAVPLICVVESVAKPGNLGAIVRTACAAGADSVVVCDPQADPYSPAVVRASLGAVFLVPVVVTSGDGAIAWLRAQRIAVCATTPGGAAEPWHTDLSGPVAVVVGNEHRGLRQRWLDAADARVRIPMLGPMESLNASTAAGVVLFEAVRQRLSSRDHGGPRARPPRAPGGPRSE